MAFKLRYRAVIEENVFQIKRLIKLKIESLNEFRLKFWRVFQEKISRVFAFLRMKGVARVHAVRLKRIMIDCN